MTDLKKMRICVLMGGRSGEREVSLRSGKRVFESLKSQGYNVISSDLNDDLIAKLKKEQVDIVFIVLHGRFGEDGTVQGMLELANIPYTGSKVLASALAMNKLASKRIFDAVGIPTPRYTEVSLDQEVDFPFPLVLKPTSEGSSLGIALIKKPEQFKPVLDRTIADFQDVFVEQYIKGREVTVGILGQGDDVVALPILELVSENEFYDFDAKYTQGKTKFILPARLSETVYKETQKIALAAHQILGCYGYSRVDIIVGPDDVPYVHDVNTIPGMTEQSDLPACALKAGISFDQLVVKMLQSAF